MPKQLNNWSELRRQSADIKTNFSIQTSIPEIIQRNRDFFVKTKSVMDGQNWFYSSKMRDLQFLENRKHYKFLATSMLPVNCGYGVATFDTLPSGPILCYNQKTPYIVGFNRDVNSSAHIDKITKGANSPWILNGCTSENEAKEGPSVGRRKNAQGQIIEDTSNRKTEGYNLWPIDWLDGRSPKELSKKDALGKIFLDTYLGYDKKSYIKYSVLNTRGQMVESQTKLLAPIPFNIGYLSPMKEDIIRVATANNHIREGDGNRAKPRLTPIDLYSSMKRRWDRVQASPYKPISYVTTNLKERCTDTDVRFLRHKHKHFNGEIDRNSLKYSEVFLAPTHLDCMAVPGSQNMDLSNLSHLIITEGVVSKASLGNVMWNVSMQYHLLKKYACYLPIHIYDHQKGLHIPLPEDNLKFLYKIWNILPLLSQEQLDTNFYYLLENHAEPNKYTSLTTSEGIVRAAHKILTIDNLRKAKELNNAANLEFILEYIAPNKLEELTKAERDDLQSIALKTNTPKITQLLDNKLNPNKLLDDAVADKDFKKIESLLISLSPEALRQYRSLDPLIALFFKEKQYVLVSFLDQKLGQWAKSRLNHKTPAQLAAAEKRWEDVLVIASHRGDTRYKGEIVNGGLGDALFSAAEHSQWDIVNRLIHEYQVTHYSWHYPANNSRLPGYFALHFAILAKQVDSIELLLKNNMDVNSRIESCITPLHLAMSTPGLENISALLLRNGANYNLKYRGEALLNLDAPVLNYAYIEPIIKHATLPFTATQLHQLVIKLVEKKKTPLITILLSRFGNEITQATKDEAFKIAKTNLYISDLTQLWAKVGEESIEKELAPAITAEPQVLKIRLGENTFGFHAPEKKEELAQGLKQIFKGLPWATQPN